MKNRELDRVVCVEEMVTVSDFPWVKICKGDFDTVFWSKAEEEPTNLHLELVRKSIHASMKSYGVIVNSFYELEPLFSDYVRNRCCQSFPPSMPTME